MEPYLGQIQLFGFNFAPKGWASCEGQIMSIAQNTALFSLLGTQYGGNGQTTFALPDLRGRVAIGQGQGPGLKPYTIGELGGVESVTLTTQQIPAHNHIINVSNAEGTSNTASNNYLATGTTVIERGTKVPANIYGTAAGGTLNAAAVGMQGGNQAHPNIQPYLALYYCIALVGIYPSRN